MEAKPERPDPVPCPFCDGTDTRLFSAFGSQLAVSTYWCNDCHTAFERMKRPGHGVQLRPE